MKELGKSERKIMEILWSNYGNESEFTRENVLEKMKDYDVNNMLTNNIRTLLDGLKRKGFIAMFRNGKNYRYKVITPEVDYINYEINVLAPEKDNARAKKLERNKERKKRVERESKSSIMRFYFGFSGMRYDDIYIKGKRFDELQELIDNIDKLDENEGEKIYRLRLNGMCVLIN